MPNVIRATPLSNAAYHESSRVDADTVDVDQLLLALLATGGSATRCLLDAGVGLEDARRAVARRRRPEGSDDDPMSQPIPVGGLDHEVLGDIPWTTRASDLFPAPGSRLTDVEFFGSLLDEESGIVADELTGLGVDIDALRRCLSAPDAPVDESSVESGEDTVFEDDAPAPTYAIDHSLAQAPEQVWSALIDPALVALWTGSPETSRVVAGGVETTFERIGSRGHTRLDPVIVEEPSEQGARVVWQERQFTDKVDGEPGGWYDLRVTPSGHGSMLRVTRGLRTFGTFGRALMPLARRSTSNGLGILAQDIAYGAARRT